jgi:hypothetical protein
MNVIQVIKRANKACSGQVGFCGIFKHFSGFGFFLLPSRIHARPLATNANRWAGKLLMYNLIDDI